MIDRATIAMMRPNATSASLSPRERQVVTLAAAGLTDAAIAYRLEVSSHTVRTHLTRIFAKLGAANRCPVRRPGHVDCSALLYSPVDGPTKRVCCRATRNEPIETM